MPARRNSRGNTSRLRVTRSPARSSANRGLPVRRDHGLEILQMLHVMFDPDREIVGHGKVAEGSVVSYPGQTIRRERPGEADDLRSALLPALKRVMQVPLLHMSRDESKRPMWVASRPVLIPSDAFQ